MVNEHPRVGDGLRLTHLGICVSDVERSVGFYTRALGFVEERRLQFDDDATARILGVDAIDVDLVYLARDGVRIELLGYKVPDVLGSGAVRPMHQTGFTHLSIAVDDLARVSSAIEDCGGRVLTESEAEFATGSRGVMTVDPDGTRIELIEVRR